MSSTRVLLVEDEPGYARFLHEILREADGQFDVASVGTVEDAATRLAGNTFDIILLDLGLPDADGTEALAAIVEAAPGTPILVLSALADLDVAVESMRLGAQEYLVKGQGEHFLLPRAIRYAIERRRHQDVLAAAKREAEHANAVKDDFLAMLGHELRNPLAPIVTGLALIRRHDHADIAHNLSIVERQVQHLTRLVDDLLDVARIARGKMAFEQKEIDVAQFVAAGAETVAPLVAETVAPLAISVPAGVFTVLGDQQRLSQVAANLLTNAAKYTPPGGHVSVTAAAEGAEIVLRVRDNGIGMAPELIRRVFDLFEQGERTIDRSAGGLGLGLPIVRNIVALHGGAVEARSDGPGQGSELVVRLPRHAPSAVPSATPVPVARAGKACRVLIVDDNVDASELLAEALADRGHVVERVDDGAKALSVAERFRPEVVLLDIGLPEVDGYEVARRMRAHFGAATPYLVAVTGYGSASDRERSKAAGFDVHLMKPIDLAAVENLLSSRR